MSGTFSFKDILSSLEGVKQAFVPVAQMDPAMQQQAMPPGGGAPMVDPNTGMPIDPNTGMPMDPMMMQGGGGMPPGMPMDPMMMQGGGGMPPVDPNTGMPMDPSMMGGGGMPPMNPNMSPEEAEMQAMMAIPLTELTLGDLIGVLEQVMGGKEGGGDKSTSNKEETSTKELSDKIDAIISMLGVPEEALMGGGMDAQSVGSGIPAEEEMEPQSLPGFPTDNPMVPKQSSAVGQPKKLVRDLLFTLDKAAHANGR